MNQNKIRILALETSGEACSATVLQAELSSNSDHISVIETFDEYKVAPRQHTQLILGMMESVLEQAGVSLQQIDAIAFGNGPGAFTGVRIATGIAQGVALSIDKPVIPISTLDAIALQAYEKYQSARIFVVNDARMKELYCAWYVFDQGVIEQQSESMLVSLEQLPTLPEGEWLGVGTGWAEYAEILTPHYTDSVKRDDSLLPSANAIAKLAFNNYQQGQLTDIAKAEPLYLRNKVAETIEERLQKKTE